MDSFTFLDPPNTASYIYTPNLNVDSTLDVADLGPVLDTWVHVANTDTAQKQHQVRVLICHIRLQVVLTEPSFFNVPACAVLTRTALLSGSWP
jgi:hypothetical protein